MTDVADLPDACRRVLTGATALGLAIDISCRAEPTRTAEEAAAACGCTVGQIVKSLVFTGRSSGKPYLLLVSGANRVDQDKMEAVIGEALDRPSGSVVRSVTGFAIGGIPPFGHATPLVTFIDHALLGYDSVWAAAGTPNSIFAINPAALATATAAMPFDPV